MTTVCPVLAFTPDIEQVQQWFQWTHEPLVTGWTPALMRCVRLPGPGSIGEQDAWLMQALSAMADAANAMLLERWNQDHPPKTEPSAS